MIPSYLAAIFPPEIRTRGDAYHAEGAVSTVDAYERFANAVVVGTQPYFASIHADHPRRVDVSCTCPYAQDVGPCKHIWALIRRLDSDGTLARILPDPRDGTPKVRLLELSEEELQATEDAQPWLPPPPLPPPPSPHPRTPQPPRPKRPAERWKEALRTADQFMRYALPAAGTPSPTPLPADRRLCYLVDIDASMVAQGLVLDIGTERRLPDGSWGKPARLSGNAESWLLAAESDPADRDIASRLLGAVPQYGPGIHRTAGFLIGRRSLATTFRAIAATGRCRIRSKSYPEVAGKPLGFDDGGAWRLELELQRSEAGGYGLAGVLARGETRVAIGAAWLLHQSGFLIMEDRVAEFDAAGAYPLVPALREEDTLPLGDDPAPALERLYALPTLPPLTLPEGMSVAESTAPPTPVVRIATASPDWRIGPRVSLDLSFRYGSRLTSLGSPGDAIFDQDTRTVRRRQRPAELAAHERLLASGAREEYDFARGRTALLLAGNRLAGLVSALTHDGWVVEGDGKSLRITASLAASISSGIDWFDLEGTVAFGDRHVPLDTVMAAYRRGEALVPLGRGTMGLVPADDMARLSTLLGSGQLQVDGSVRFRRSQLPLLDALLAAIPTATADETFATARRELATFDRIAPADAPPSFTGTLRDYQRAGLGWLHFLRTFGLGGCLADDMGLGKTVQVLALLESRRVEGHGPSLVVVPRSLVFNWLHESARFAPALRVIDVSGAARDVRAIDAKTVDVAITTYGTLRRDTAALAELSFDYVILDEAQAIKNANTATAKACRLLRASHRLALSGTPIENRLEELWSLLDFLNPGILGPAGRFSILARQGAAAPRDSLGTAGSVDEGAALLARALRPVILRRTKGEVARELPARVEQTLEVELEPKQRKFYDAIRTRYQQQVLQRVDTLGLDRSRMHILEALLRLRQAACHPVLADPSKGALPSAKLDTLVPALQEIAAEGHKALVFSQFTEFLALLRARLDEAAVPYEYLDGRTRDRQARVERFQRDQACPLFLISLKAGGHGLNLTAAEYVYLLDPWWNPAVEAQAIDRAHRIGQSRRVIATRLVARDTIEAKILQLQSGKRALADAILAGDKGGLAGIGREELELLLG